MKVPMSLGVILETISSSVPQLLILLTIASTSALLTTTFKRLVGPPDEDEQDDDEDAVVVGVVFEAKDDGLSSRLLEELVEVCCFTFDKGEDEEAEDLLTRSSYSLDSVKSWTSAMTS